jgi:hypothetical protein
MTPRVKSALQDWNTETIGMSEYVFFNPQCPSGYIRSVKTAWHNALKKAGLPAFAIYRAVIPSPQG